jgi:serine/threonine protein kinase
MSDEQQLRADDPLIKTTIAERYKILAVIGTGGWSRVYEALDETLNRTVAFKVLHPYFVVDSNRLERFRREAESASILSHANVAAVYDFGQLPNGRPFIVMELIRGESIADIIRLGKRFDTKECIDIFAQVADGLNAAHEIGFIHRDLKPSNIMLTPRAVPKIVDFGTAKFIFEDGQSLTNSDELVGTPSYMSPEQCLGGRTDARSDIYSLGCVMYEAVTGIKAFPGDNVVNCIRRQVTEMPPRIDTLLPPDRKIPVTLEKIIFKALSKQASERFPSMAKLAKELRQCDQTPNLISFICSDLAIRQGSSRTVKRWQIAMILAVTVLFVVVFSYNRMDVSQFQSIVAQADSAYKRNKFSAAQLLYSQAMKFAGDHPGSANASAKLEVLDQLIRIGTQNKDDASVFAYLSQAVAICNDIHDNVKRDRYEDERNPVAEYLASSKIKYPEEIDVSHHAGAWLTHLVASNPRVIDLFPLSNAEDPDLLPLKHATSTEEINMNGQTGITDQALEYISHLKKLRRLDLTITSVSKLKPLLPLRNSLESLSVKSTLLDSDGMSVIGRLTKLSDLDLSRTGITDPDLKKLYDLRLLETLRLTDCHLTKAALDQLRHVLPRVRIGGKPRPYISLQKETSGLIAEHHYSQALQDIKETLRIPTISPSSRANALEAKAACENRLNQFESADKTYVECLQLLKEQHPDETRIECVSAVRQENIFDQCRKASIQGKHKEAASLFDYALKVGPNPRDVPSLVNEGDCQLALKHIRLAQDCYSQGERLLKEAPDPRWSAVITDKQATACEQLKQFDRAITLRLLWQEKSMLVERAMQASPAMRNEPLANLRALVVDYLESTSVNSAARAYTMLQQLFAMSASYGVKPDSGDAALIERVGDKLSIAANHQAALSCFLNEQTLFRQHPELAAGDNVQTRLQLEIERERRLCSKASGAR